MIILLDLAMIGFYVAANAGEQQGPKSFSERSERSSPRPLEHVESQWPTIGLVI